MEKRRPDIAELTFELVSGRDFALLIGCWPKNLQPCLQLAARAQILEQLHAQQTKPEKWLG
jgi:hypothetical protein